MNLTAAQRAARHLLLMAFAMVILAVASVAITACQGDRKQCVPSATVSCGHPEPHPTP